MNNVFIKQFAFRLFAILPLYITITICGQANSQTLSFSQVLMVAEIEDTVPPGKVWKVESFIQKDAGFVNSTTTNCASSNIHPYVVNGNNYYMIGSSATGLGTTIGTVGYSFPFWMPSGTRLKTLCANDYLSVIEFTVTP